MSAIKLMIADDHAIFREGLKLLLKSIKTNEVELIGEAANGQELIQLVEEKLPDIALIDIQMPIMDGIEATKILNFKFPTIGIIALSSFNEEGMVVDMLLAGARGYLLKNTNKAELLMAIKKVDGGGVYFSPETTAHLAKKIEIDEAELEREKNIKKFSEKEIEVIKLLCMGHLNKEIASLLHISKRTVEGYRMSITEKMGAKNAIDVMTFAIRNKIYKI